MKLTPEQRDLIDTTVLNILRSSSCPLPFSKIDADARPKFRSSVPAKDPGLFFRYVDQSLQRLRKQGHVQCVDKRWLTASPA